ncbi:DUF4097 family beta strand repeat-containing protein [Anaerosacchariphilus polymeriproducens]|uniref:DUF4097 domain-containing protein n=1 Tax=Anaerosacchariphilus polymeriproducens TaxID=1812858 RepID=A0A371AS25_9FIRM|nr:DUF4097 family beta strand repeat-containing protein [Anaerosacchariphilus polymeriproducens]RDU22280.1 hypothetical protein DWV06_17330 [Anaerosacchariphilus polymeriproducens]
MKRLTKVCLILVVVFLGIGILLAVVGTAMGFRFGNIRDISGLTNLTKQEKYEYPLEEIKNLDIKVDAGKLEINSGDEDKIVVIMKRKDDYGTCYQDGNKLVIHEKLKKSFWKLFENYGTEVKIYLPKDYKFEKGRITMGAGEANIERFYGKEISFDVGAGSLHGDTIAAAEKMELSAGAGEIDIEKMQAKDTSVECGVGSISLSGKVDGDISADCGIGEISLDLDGKENDFNYILKSGVGDMEINDNKFHALGNDKKIDHNAKKTINMECGVGSIDVNVN